MARDIQPRDIYALINEIGREATGQEPEISAVDTSTFCALGETILSTGLENTLNAISTVLARTIIAVRPYSSKFGLIEETDTALYKNRVRKISYYSRYALPSGDWNTQLFTNFDPSFDNGQNFDGNGDPQSTKSMWSQEGSAMPFELNFSGLSTWQDSNVVWRDQLKVAFTDEESFSSFIAGILTEKENDIEVQRESYRRMAFLNHVGAVYSAAENYPSMAVNLTSAFNTEFGTSYTSEELRTTYLKQFLEFFVSTLKIYSRRLEYRSALHHMPFTKTVNGVEYNILRHTPREDQRLFMFSPLLIKSESMVMPEIFNDQYLKIENYEAVDFWQNINDPAKVMVTPTVYANDGTQTTGETVEIPYLCAVLMDKDACVMNNYLDYALSSPIEARKSYYTVWYHFCKNVCSDLSENCILFYMKDGDTPAPGGKMNITPSSVTITVDEQGMGSATATVSGIPANSTTVEFTGEVNAYVEEVIPGEEGTATIYFGVTGFDASTTFTDLLVSYDNNSNVLGYCDFTLNIVVPEG